MAHCAGRGGVRTLRIGIQLPGSERRVGWPEYLAMGRAAEKAGFDSIRVGDHLLYRDDDRTERGPLEVWTLLAALAATTSRIRLGPLVACAAFHPPGLIAKMTATVDAISGGRLVLGLGAGWNETEFRSFGLPFNERVARFEESFEIVRRLLAGERVTLAGRFWSADNAVLVPPPEHRIPLMIGSNGDRMLAIGLPYVDWWNSWYSDYGNTVDGYAEIHARISAAAERAGRHPDEVARSVGVLAEPNREAAEQARSGKDRPLALAELPDHLRMLAEAGADEVIIILRTMTAEAIHAVAGVLPALAGVVKGAPAGRDDCWPESGRGRTDPGPGTGDTG
jgi:alkanesulfonate monooxygenase SsuD/methylene tetrahydromethanopterin reductase-like flavin-dependent oxidoreductase (luciferase family)